MLDVISHLPPPAVQDSVSAARSLKDLLLSHAGQCETEGQIAEPVVAALRQVGLFHLSAPKRVGGGGANLATFVDTVAEIGRSCPATAWSFGILSATTGFCWAMPHLRSQLFPTGDELCCSVVARSGTGVRANGGWKVTGSWGYASGCMHARWALCGVSLFDEEANRTDGGMAFIDLECADEVEIECDWHVAGLSGTGSNRVRTKAHFVPDSLVLLDSTRRHQALDFQQEQREPRDSWPEELQTPLTLVPAMIGAAEGILEEVRGRMGSRPIANWNYARQTDSDQFLAMLGEAAIKIESARMHLHRACALGDVTAQQRPVSQAEKARAQADCGYAMRLVREAGNILMDIAGPAAFALSDRIQRLWRDLNLGSRHNSINAGLSLELYGRFLTGQSSNLPILTSEPTEDR